MKQVYGKLFVILTLVLFFGCSSSEESTKQENMEKKETGEFKKVDADDGGVVPEGEVQETQPTEKNAPVVKEPPLPTGETSQPITRTGIVMWSVQLGAFKNENGAVQLVNEIKGKFNQPVYKDYDPVSGFYKVTLGSFQTREQASSFKAEVQAKGYPDAFTVEVRR